jgi:hypothetical protein
LGHSCLFNGQILNGRVIEGVLSFLQERYTAQPRNSEVFNSLCDVPRSELIQYILGAIVGGMSGTAKDPTRIRFDKLRSFSKYTVGLGERDCNRESWLNSITARVATSNLTRDRKWEIDCLKKEIGLAPGGLVLAVTCPVLLEDRNHKCIAEIDGVFVRVDGIQLDVTLLEAKNTAKSATTLAKQDLEKKVKTLKLGGAISQVRTGEGYAAVTISFGS